MHTSKVERGSVQLLRDLTNDTYMASRMTKVSKSRRYNLQVETDFTTVDTVIMNCAEVCIGQSDSSRQLIDRSPDILPADDTLDLSSLYDVSL